MAILSGLAYQPIAAGGPAHETGKAINTGLLDWTVAAKYLFDPTQTLQLRGVETIQSIFVDNVNTTGTTVVTASSTGQVLRVPPGAQACLPVMAFNAPVLTLENQSGNGNTQFWFSNVPAFGGVWQSPSVHPNILQNASVINTAPWGVGGTGVTATGPTTLQTGAGASSLMQTVTLTPGTYTVSVTVACATGNVFVALYATNYSSNYGNASIGTLTNTPQTASFTATVPGGVTAANFELDFNSTASGIATVTNAQVRAA